MSKKQSRKKTISPAPAETAPAVTRAAVVISNNVHAAARAIKNAILARYGKAGAENFPALRLDEEYYVPVVAARLERGRLQVRTSGSGADWQTVTLAQISLN